MKDKELYKLTSANAKIDKEQLRNSILSSAFSEKKRNYNRISASVALCSLVILVTVSAVPALHGKTVNPAIQNISIDTPSDAGVLVTEYSMDNEDFIKSDTFDYKDSPYSFKSGNDSRITVMYKGKPIERLFWYREQDITKSSFNERDIFHSKMNGD
ncbi:MAG: hypothetical protein CVU97_04720 [Firmicutes bacterium HGW-Firmicutes-21]|nr:MAG: hypothetical protein CVU97_04720 [Firmicutes bacterium HGW-Firmicutes-21]